MLLDRIVKVETLTNQSGDSDKEDYQLKVSSLPMQVQPASDETIVLHEGKMGQTFTAFAPPSASGIEMGDKVTTISGVGIDDTYIVKGKKDWNMPPLPHFEFVLFRDK